MRDHLIGIKKLPPVAASLTTGRVYVVMHDAGSGLEVVCKTLVAACVSGHAGWIAESPAAYLGVPLELSREVAECLSEGELRIFQAQAGERRGMCRAMLEELDFIGVAPGSLIVVEGVDRFIEQAGADSRAEDVAAWQQWAERNDCAVLWMCPRRAGKSDHESDLLRMAHRFSGLARLRGSGDELHWHIYYWFTNEGLIVDKHYRLDMDGNGNLCVGECGMQPAGAAESAADENDVFIMRDALPDGQSAPNGWRVFDTLKQMSVALSSARAPTVVFHCNADSPLEALARSIFELRHTIGPRAKIVVKEGGRLRHSHEQLLLSVGANLTIPRETGFARMQRLLKLIHGQVYSHTLPSVFEEAIASVVSVARTGYMAPAEFPGAVTEAMEQTRLLQLHNALIRLSMTPGMGTLETLRCCTIKRPGDMYTAIGESVYVFLFACEEKDISATLDRLFRLPISVLFSVESRYLDSKDIAGVLAELDLRCTETPCEDFTTALAGYAPAEPPPTGDPRTAAAIQPPPRRAFTAVPHALPLRAART